MSTDVEVAGEGAAGSSKRLATYLGVGCVLLLLVAVLGFAILRRKLHPYWNPTEYIPSIEKTAAPTIAAIDAYTARTGHPPASLQDLLPEYDASLAGTGYPPQDEFFYRTWRNNEWVLVLWAELVALDCDVIQYGSTKRKWEFVRVR